MRTLAIVNPPYYKAEVHCEPVYLRLAISTVVQIRYIPETRSEAVPRACDRVASFTLEVLEFRKL